jgi:hypothetical protein
MMFPASWSEPRRFAQGWALLGFATGMSLVVFCRDAVQASMGIELAWVPAVAAWLLGVAAGAALSCVVPALLIDYARAAMGLVAACMPLYALYFMRAACSMAGVPPGGQLGFGWALWNLAVTLGATGLFIGCHVSLTARATTGPVHGHVAASIGMAGLAAALLLGPLGLQPFVLISIAALVYVAGAALLQGQWLPVYASLAALLVWAPAVGLMRSLDVITLLPRHALLAHRGVTYGVDGQVALAIVSGKPTLLVDGRPHLRLGDTAAAQGLAHAAMVQHPAPEQLLVVGGLGGVLAEALKHPVTSATDIEVEPGARAVAEPIVSDAAKGALYERRVSVISADARSTIESSTGRWDVILIAASMPPTLAGGRLQTLEFYQAVRRALKPGGVVGVMISPVADGHTSAGWLRDSAIMDSVRAAFPYFMALPFSSNCALASERPLEADPAVWMRIAQARGVQSPFLDPRNLGLSLQVERLADATASIITRAPRPARDGRPPAYRLAPTYGSEADRSLAARLVIGLRAPGPWLPALVAALLTLLVILAAARLAPYHQDPPPRELDSPWYADEEPEEWPEPEPRRPWGPTVRALGAPAAAAVPVAVYASLVVTECARSMGSAYLILPAALAAALSAAGAGSMLSVKARWPGVLAALFAIGALAGVAFAPPLPSHVPLLVQLAVWIGGIALLGFLAGLAAAGCRSAAPRFEATTAAIASSAALGAFFFTYASLPRWGERWSLVSVAGACLLVLVACWAAPRCRHEASEAPSESPASEPDAEALPGADNGVAPTPSDESKAPDAAPSPTDEPRSDVAQENPA